MYPDDATSSANSCTQSDIPKISWITSTTGRLSFTSGYTTNVSTDRPSCFTVTHSPCLGDFASAAFAQSCAQAGPAANPAKITAITAVTTTLRITRFICQLLYEKPPANFSSFSFRFLFIHIYLCPAS